MTKYHCSILSNRNHTFVPVVLANVPPPLKLKQTNMRPLTAEKLTIINLNGVATIEPQQKKRYITNFEVDRCEKPITALPKEMTQLPTKSKRSLTMRERKEKALLAMLHKYR